MYFDLGLIQVGHIFLILLSAKLHVSDFSFIRCTHFADCSWQSKTNNRDAKAEDSSSSGKSWLPDRWQKFSQSKIGGWWVLGSWTLRTILAVRKLQLVIRSNFI